MQAQIRKELMMMYFTTFVKDFIDLDTACELYDRLLRKSKKPWPEISSKDEVLLGILSEVHDLSRTRGRYLKNLHRKFKERSVHIPIEEYADVKG